MESDAIKDSSTNFATRNMSAPKLLRLNQVRRPDAATGYLMTLTDVQEALGVGAVVVYDLVREGHLRTVQVGGWLKYLSWEVEAVRAAGYHTLLNRYYRVSEQRAA